MRDKYVCIYTIGCQMNVYDSEQIALRMAASGYQQTSSLQRADLIIVNTCTIRAKAEQKAFSLLGRLANLKRKKPGLIIGVGGCVAQQEGEKILKRVPHLDIVFGTQAIDRLSSIVEQVEKKRCRVVDVRMQDTPEPLEALTPSGAENPVSQFVTIMRGCDNYCAYCVVPHVRGREASRHPDRIIKEIERLVESGVKEVTLLGQNVNSYGKKEGLCGFSDLLSRVNDIEGLLRIRFTTSHPKDFNEDLLKAFERLEKLCQHIHLPVQSGSNKILKRMNRKYTRELYLDKVSKLRDTCPKVAITSDFIVGFPGETEVDFEETLDLVKRVEFDGLFAFMYSDRPNAPSALFTNKVEEQQKKDRLQTLLELQEKYTVKKNQALVGSIQSILAEGFSKKQISGGRKGKNLTEQWTGRTSTNKVVNFYRDNNSLSCGQLLTGKIVAVRIDKAFAHSLWGKPVKVESTAGELKGEESYAA